MKLEYEDRGDGLHRCVDCKLGFDASHPSAAISASSCCPHRKHERYSRTVPGRAKEVSRILKRRVKTLRKLMIEVMKRRKK